MKLNKRGVLAEVIVVRMFYGLAVSMIIASALLASSHRVRKANKQCIKEGSSVPFCKSLVKTMDKDEVLDYIRDDDMTSGNQGNF